MSKYVVVQNMYSQTVGTRDRVINNTSVLWAGDTVTAARKWCMKHSKGDTSMWVLHTTGRYDFKGEQIIYAVGGVWKTQSIKNGKVVKDWFWHEYDKTPRAIRKDGTLCSESDSKRKLGTY